MKKHGTILYAFLFALFSAVLHILPEGHIKGQPSCHLFLNDPFLLHAHSIVFLFYFAFYTFYSASLNRIQSSKKQILHCTACTHIYSSAGVYTVGIIIVERWEVEINNKLEKLINNLNSLIFPFAQKWDSPPYNMLFVYILTSIAHIYRLLLHDHYSHNNSHHFLEKNVFLMYTCSSLNLFFLNNTSFLKWYTRK